MNTKDIKIGEKHMSLLKGAPGTGKSIAAHSIHIYGPTFTYDFDQKMDAVASRYPKVNFEYEQFPTVFPALTLLDKHRTMAENGTLPYKSIIWDGWHTFASLCLISALEVRAPGKKKIKVGNREGDIERYQVEDYGVEGRAIEQATDDLKALYRCGINIIAIAHWRRVSVTNITTQREEISEGLFIPGGKMAFAIPTPYNESYWFSIESDLSTGNGNQFMCETTGIHDTKTVLNVPNKFNWTINKDNKRGFYELLMDYHKKESNVIKL